MMYPESNETRQDEKTTKDEGSFDEKTIQEAIFAALRHINRFIAVFGAVIIVLKVFALAGRFFIAVLGVGIIVLTVFALAGRL